MGGLGGLLSWTTVWKRKNVDLRLGCRLFSLHVKHHLVSPLCNCGVFTLLLCCTQAKLFITKGMVFNTTFTVVFVYAWGCFCQSGQDTCEILMVDTEVERERERASICAAMCPTEGHGEVPEIQSCNSINSVNLKPVVRSISSLLWFHHYISACLGSQITG